MVWNLLRKRFRRTYLHLPCRYKVGFPGQETVALFRNCLLMDDDAATSKLGGVVRIVGRSLLVIVDDGVVIISVPDLDPELVCPTAATN